MFDESDLNLVNTWVCTAAAHASTALSTHENAVSRALLATMPACRQFTDLLPVERIPQYNFTSSSTLTIREVGCNAWDSQNLRGLFHCQYSAFGAGIITG